MNDIVYEGYKAKEKIIELAHRITLCRDHLRKCFDVEVRARVNLANAEEDARVTRNRVLDLEDELSKLLGGPQ